MSFRRAPGRIRHFHRVDRVQPEIVAALERVGCSVVPLSVAIAGVPDLLVGRGGANYLLECKSEDGDLSESQRRWHDRYRGTVSVVRTVEEALTAIGLPPIP